MAEEFNKILKEAKKGTSEEKINALTSIIEDMMHIILKIPDIFDEMMNSLNDKIIDLEQKFNNLNRLKTTTDTTILSSKSSPIIIQSKENLREDPTYKSSNVKKLIMDELKGLFEKKKEMDRKMLNTRNAKSIKL
ncbi:MAG: hypothetical protein ACFFAN_13805 [Promethearchaeota archaeon]